jgi:hypothetical protein
MATSFIIIVVVLLLIPAVYAILRHNSEKEGYEDIENSRDDGYFRRYPGSVIEYYRNEKDLHRVVLSDPLYMNRVKARFKVEAIQGVRKTVLYSIPVQHDPVPIFNYYSNELKKSGFDILYSIYGKEKMGRAGLWIKELYITDKNVAAWEDLSEIMNGDIHFYISGIKKNESKDVYASVFSTNHIRNDKRTGVFVFITDN